MSELYVSVASKTALTTGLSHLYRRAYAYDPRKHKTLLLAIYLFH